MEDIESKILKKYDTAIWNSLDHINSNRAKNLSIMLAVIITLLLIIDYFNNKRGLWQLKYGYILLFYTHIICILVFSFLILLYYMYRNRQKPYFHKLFSLGFSFFVLNINAFFSGWIDQMINGQIIVYAFACFLIAFSFYFERTYIIILYLQSYLMFILYLYTVQKNSDILQGNYINSFFIIIISVFISIYISNLMKSDYIYKHKLEELVKTRSDALIMQQQAINRLQNLNLVGELSAGIAHEIRNPMTSVRGFLQLLGNKDYYKKDKEYFDLMIEELDRANSIITDFLGFSKDKKIEYEDKDLNNIILRLIPLLDTNVLYDIITDLGEIPTLSLADKEISQVILNLANNGYESMPSGGCLTIKTYKANDKVILEIQDQGSGIKPEILEKLGTPFFTTKDKGTGLGLAICSTIIEQHNAKLDIVSDSNGSNFRVIFNIAS